VNEELVAPCGMNCAICSQYLALKHDVKSKGIRIPYCPGCRPRDKNCAFIKQKCDLLRHKRVRYCYECSDFPCQQLKKLDERYRKHHRMSMIENLENIRDNGINSFLAKEHHKWQCTECGGVICCHNGLCFTCDLDRLLQQKPRYKYRWEE
jgi:DNA topoisomerase IB